MITHLAKLVIIDVIHTKSTQLRQNNVYKEFIHNRKDPAPNIIARYSARALLRHCPASIRSQISFRWASRGLQSRGLLSSVQNKIDDKGCIPGSLQGTRSGQFEVDVSRRQGLRVKRVDLEEPLRNFIFDNRLHLLRRAFSYFSRHTRVKQIKAKTASVTLDGRDLRVDGVHAIMWLDNRSGDTRVGSVAGMSYIYSTQETGHAAMVIKVSCTHNAQFRVITDRLCMCIRIAYGMCTYIYFVHFRLDRVLSFLADQDSRRYPTQFCHTLIAA